MNFLTDNPYDPRTLWSDNQKLVNALTDVRDWANAFYNQATGTITITGDVRCARTLGVADTNGGDGDKWGIFGWDNTLVLSLRNADWSWNANLMSLNSAGLAGIGMAPLSAGVRLAVAGSTYNTAAPATYPGTLQINESGIGTASLATTAGLEFKCSVYGAGYGAKITALDNGTLVFGRRGNSATWSETMRLDDQGRLGLNIVPAVGPYFHMAGKFRIQGAADTASYWDIDHNANNALDYGLKFSRGGTEYLVLCNIEGGSVSYFPTGYVGIGVAPPLAKLHLHNGRFRISGENSAAGELAFDFFNGGSATRTHAIGPGNYNDNDFYISNYSATKVIRLTSNGFNALVLGPGAVVNVPGLTASQRVETDASKNLISKANCTAQANSTATTVAGIVADFNSLLAKLRTAGLMAP